MTTKFDRPLSVGTYEPTESFKSAPRHVAVMFDDDQTLVALTGYSDDLDNRQESIDYACLFAASPTMLEALERAADVFKRFEDLSHSERIYELQQIRAAIAKVYSLNPA